MTELGDDEFVGYAFKFGAPEIRHRLWFLDRELYKLALWGIYSIPADWNWTDLPVGTWTSDMPRHLGEGRWQGTISEERIKDAVQAALPGLPIRWEDRATGRATVWRLTDVVINHVHTFGRDDDVWRLGVWPD